MNNHRAQFGVVQALTVLLTLFTAAVHLYMGLSYYDPLFIMNGLGFVGLLVALFLPIPVVKNFRGIWRWLLVGYTALTIIMYFVVNGLAVDAMGLVTKAAEAALVVLLFLDGRRLATQTRM